MLEEHSDPFSCKLFNDLEELYGDLIVAIRGANSNENCMLACDISKSFA